MSFVCVYILKKQNKTKPKKKKKIQDFQNFPKKKKKNFQKNLWTRDTGLPIDFFKKGPFFFFQRFQDS